MVKVNNLGLSNLPDKYKTKMKVLTNIFLFAIDEKYIFVYSW